MNYNKIISSSFLLLTFFILSSFVIDVNNDIKKFVLVIDAGHGGEDTGAKGVGGVKEKDITLKVALNLGELIKKKYKDVEVVYTRETDVFIPLQERAKIANKNKADFFISIHCNASKNSSAIGTETYVLGLHRNDENFEVSKRENSVIFLEENYEEKYEGFNPNSPESVIGLTLIQNIHLDNSILFAKFIEDYQKVENKISRGVKQAGFLVLRQTAMPSILTEIGFISNPEEGIILDTEEGKIQTVDVLFNAFSSYKKIVDDRLKFSRVEDTNKTVIQVKNAINVNDKLTFKVQLASSSTKLKRNAAIFKKFGPVEVVKVNNIYKYYCSETKNEEEAILKLNQAKKNGFPDAFITRFSNNF